MLQIVKPKMVVADASNYKTIQNTGKTVVKNKKIPFHVLAKRFFKQMSIISFQFDLRQPTKL
jgi:competence protein ComEC